MPDDAPEIDLPDAVCCYYVETVPCPNRTSFFVGEKMTVFMIGFGIGCLTGGVVGLVLYFRRGRDSTSAPAFWTSPTDSQNQ